MTPAEIIHQISVISYDAVQEAQKEKNPRPGFTSLYKDGWSPEAMAHIAHLRAFIEIRRHIFGQAMRKKWKANNNYFNTYARDIGQIVKTWKK